MLRTNEEYDGKSITPDVDARAVLIRELRDDLFASKHLLDTIEKGGEADQSLAHSILYMKEARLAQFCKLLGIELDSATERENRYADIRHANEKVRLLERELGQTGSPKQTAAHLSALAEKLNYWWDCEGFGHISELQFNQYGSLHAKFSCHLFGVKPLTGSNTPVSDKDAFQMWIQALTDRGFDVVQVRGEREPALADTDANRAALQALFAKALPSARINSTANYFHHAYGGGLATLRDLSVHIHKLEDVQALPDKPNDDA